MKLQQFSGGLNIKDATHLLKINEAVKYENIDNESGELKPCKALTKLGSTFTENDKYIKHLDVITSLVKTPLDFIEYQNKIYYSVEDDFIQMKDNNGEGDLGLYNPQLSADLIAIVRPARPLISDIGVLEYTVIAFFPQFGWTRGEEHIFAFQRVGDDGSLSDVFEFNYTTTAGPGFLILGFTLPYQFNFYNKQGGIWRQLTGEVYLSEDHVPFDFSADAHKIVPVGLANTRLDTAQVGLASDFDRTVTNWYKAKHIVTGLVPESFSTKLSTIDLQGVIDIGIASLPTSTYSYVATVKISILGWESEPSNIVTIVVDGIADVSLLILEFTDDVAQRYPNLTSDIRIDRLNIYRLGNNFTDFILITTIHNPVFPVSFTDTILEENILSTTILDTENNDKPLTDLKNLNIINGQLISLLGTKLYFSPIGKLFALPPVNFREFRETLTGTFNIDAGLLVCSLSKTWLLNTSNIATGKVIQLSEEFGCTSQKTMTGWKTGAIWSSEFGLCSSFGGKVELIAKGFLGYNNLNITHAKMFNETYFGFTSQGTVIALDLRYGISIKKFNFAAVLDSDENTILRQIYIQNQRLKVLFGTSILIDSYTIFGSTENEVFVWKSPDFLEGSYTDLKTYKDIYVYATKDINFKTFINDILVNETDFIIEDNHHIKVEHDKHQGYRISFEATGKGTIREIEYKAMGSQDGR